MATIVIALLFGSPKYYGGNGGVLLRLIVIALAAVGFFWFKTVFGKENRTFYADTETDGKALNTVELVMQTLTEMGCQPKKEDDRCVLFGYQGEEFKINTYDTNNIIWIYNVGWNGLPLDDPDVDCLKEAVNKTNEVCAMTTLYTVNKEENYIALHCHMTVYFSADIPNLKGYLASILNSFFTAHDTLRMNFQNQTEEKEKCK